MIFKKYVCINDMLEDEDPLSSRGNCYRDSIYNVEIVDLQHINLGNIYRVYSDNVYLKTLYNDNLLEKHFITYGEWKALRRNEQIESILNEN